MSIEIRMNWTPNQWRRFLGQPDMTPLVELGSVVMDKIALLSIDERLAALQAELEKRKPADDNALEEKNVKLDREPVDDGD